MLPSYKARIQLFNYYQKNNMSIVRIILPHSTISHMLWFCWTKSIPTQPTWGSVPHFSHSFNLLFACFFMSSLFFLPFLCFSFFFFLFSSYHTVDSMNWWWLNKAEIYKYIFHRSVSYAFYVSSSPKHGQLKILTHGFSVH